MPDEGSCGACGEPYVREEWNTTTDIVVCDNPKCTRFRVPAYNSSVGIVVNGVKKVKGKGYKYKGPEVPVWLGGPSDGKTGSFASRVQGLRSRLRPEDKETEIP